MKHFFSSFFFFLSSFFFVLSSSFFFLSSSFFVLPSFSQPGFTGKSGAGNEYINKQKSGKWIVYFDDDFRETAKENASYYRLITYRDGKPDGSIVHEYTMDDRLVFEGKIIGVSADLYDGVCKWFYKNGTVEQEWTYRQGKAEGMYKSFYENGILKREGNYRNDKADGLHKWFDETGKLQEEWNYYNGKAEGVSKIYFPSGKLKREGNYGNHKAEGLHKWYNENGVLSEEWNYVNGLAEGIGKTYHPNGVLKTEGNYSAGKAEGIHTTYYENGKIKLRGNYKNDKADGFHKWYSEGGKTEQEWNYVNGVAEGTGKTFFPNGALKTEGNYVNGKAEGNHKTFYQSGKLYIEGNYKNDKAEGLHKWFYEDGKIKEEWFYADGKANGTGKTYYENGQLKSEGNYKDHKIHGHHKNFYENGALWEESIYMDDKKEGYKRYFDDGAFSHEENYETAKARLGNETSAEKTRGGGDPLKGLNVEKAADISIGNYYALIIGIDKYNGAWNELNNAVNDAKAVESTLKGKYRFEHFRTLYDAQATRENIISEFEWLMQNVKENDNVLVYYSGHGEYKKELNKGYWVPVDASTASLSKYISNSDLQTFLGGIKAKHTLLISDACFSGDIFRGNTLSVPFEESEKYYKEVYTLASRQALTSGGLEPVTDGGKDGHSVFTYYLLKILNENSGRYFDAGQLFEKIKIPVTNNSEQSPKFSPIKNIGDEGGQFIFIKK